MANEYEETLTYHFDCGAISPGTVNISENKVKIDFPSISTVKENTSSNCKNVQVFINRKLCLSFEWLPFFSFFDRVRIMDIFVKAYESYTNLIQWYYFSPYPHTNKSNRSWSMIISEMNIDNLIQVYCLEDYNITSIQIETHQPPSLEELTEQEVPVHFCLSIANNCVLCTKHEDLKFLPPPYIYFLIQFILFKIVHLA